MKIFIICSKAFYDKIPPIQKYLEKKGMEVCLPHSINNPQSEQEAWNKSKTQHLLFKQEMLKKSEKLISKMDAVLCLNYEKNGQKNYIGGSTFLELYEAFMKNKKIYLYNDIPSGMLYDEIHGFSPIIINANLDLIK